MSAFLRRFVLKVDSRIQSRLSPALKIKWNHPAGWIKTNYFQYFILITEGFFSTY